LNPLSEPAAEGQRTVGVLIVDDQPAFRRAARTVIDATAGFEAVGESASGAEALVHAEDLRPDLILLDVNMLGMDGFETARRLAESLPECVVVLFSIEAYEDVPALAA
jgi:DNA-binding NarL/FixJ family response regulator